MRLRDGDSRLTLASALDPSHVAASAGSVAEAAQHLHTHLNLIASIADAPPAPPPSDGGPLDFLADGFETLLKFIDNGLEGANVPYSYGFSIIALTILVKLATFPLSQKQVESSVAVQALQPRVKELQAKYVGEPETLQLETARLYREAGVNPLAGCLPTLATIPVFIGLYKALTNAADEGLGQESFFWIPDLSGPATLTQRTEGAGLGWLFPFVDGAPPIGWGNAAAYLVMPILLVLSQYASMKIISPPTNKDDPAAQQSQAILKFLPLMIGWFSLNVPSGLTLYWFVNNILSTGQQLYLKSTSQVNIPPSVLDKATETVGTVVKPKEERVKKVAGKDVGARRRKSDDGTDIIDVEGEVVSSSSEATHQQQPSGGSRGKGSKGEKFRALKAREAAGKAAGKAASTVEVADKQ